MADAWEDKKARSTYDWFFNHAKWDKDEIAQRKTESLSIYEDSKIIRCVI